MSFEYFYLNETRILRLNAPPNISLNETVFLHRVPKYIVAIVLCELSFIANISCALVIDKNM
jgi:hypothetical protein